MTSVSTTNASNPGNSQRTKLTGWAQAAARSLPKNSQTQGSTQQLQQQQQQQQHQLQKSRSNTASPTSMAAKSSGPLNSASNKSVASGNDNKNGKKKNVKQPYNRDEVKKLMKGLFEEHSSNLPNKSIYHNMVHNNRQGKSLDWGTVTNNRYKNKKYGCLNEISQVLWK